MSDEIGRLRRLATSGIWPSLCALESLPPLSHARGLGIVMSMILADASTTAVTSSTFPPGDSCPPRVPVRHVWRRPTLDTVMSPMSSHQRTSTDVSSIEVCDTSTQSSQLSSMGSTRMDCGIVRPVFDTQVGCTLLSSQDERRDLSRSNLNKAVSLYRYIS